MKARKRYTAKFEKGERLWVVQLVELPSCISQARTIEQGKARIREALSLYIGDDAETVEIVVEPVLPASVKKAVKRSLEARERADAEVKRAARSVEQAVLAVLDLGLSTRDAGELLGLTRQRVHQVAQAAGGEVRQ